MDFEQQSSEALTLAFKDGTGGAALRDTRRKLEELKVQQHKVQQGIVRFGHQVHAMAGARYVQGGEHWNRMDGSGAEINDVNDVLSVEASAPQSRIAGSFTSQGQSSSQHTFQALYLHSLDDDDDDDEWGNGESPLVKTRDSEALARRIEREMAQRQAHASTAHAPTGTRRRRGSVDMPVGSIPASHRGIADVTSNTTSRRGSIDMGGRGPNAHGVLGNLPPSGHGSGPGPVPAATSRRSSLYIPSADEVQAGAQLLPHSPPTARFGRRSSAVSTSYDSFPVFGPGATATGGSGGGTAAAGAAGMGPLQAQPPGHRHPPTKHASLHSLHSHGGSPASPVLPHMQLTPGHGAAGGPESSSAPHSMASSAAGSGMGSPISRTSTNPETITNILKELSEEHSVGLLSAEQSKQQGTYGRSGARKAPTKAISRLCLATGPQAATGQSNHSGLAPVAVVQPKVQDPTQSASQPQVLPPPPMVVPLNQIMQSAADRYDPHRELESSELHPQSTSATPGASGKPPARRRRSLAMDLVASTARASGAAAVERSGNSCSSLGSRHAGESALSDSRSFRSARTALLADMVERAGSHDSLDQWAMNI